MRKSSQFRKADALRKEIQKMGYTLADYKNQTEIYPVKKDIPPKQSFLVLFGSGETSSTAVKIHDYVFKKMAKKEIRVVLVSTPAGFQPNVKTVYEEIAQFFRQHLQNYHPRVQIIYANTLSQANNPEVIKSLDAADYIFTGPGSPTYTVNHLKNSLLYQKIGERVKKGATLSLASAAAIAFSHFALPVYEIYKVGEPLHWIEGLDFYSLLFKRLTIVPHFDNREGGKKNDTSRCFMGKERFQSLLKLLPKKEKIWGIDEHTAVVINLKSKKLLTLGKGKLHSVAEP
jgi:cyanophycinase-like exopeptidase